MRILPITPQLKSFSIDDKNSRRMLSLETKLLLFLANCIETHSREQLANFNFREEDSKFDIVKKEIEIN